MDERQELVSSTGVLSYSVKIEFIVKINIVTAFGPQAANNSYNRNRRAVHEQITEYLRKHGARVNDYRAFRGDLQAWQVEKGIAVDIDDVPDIDYESEEWYYFDVKLGSPVLPYTRSSFFDVERVITLIKDEYDPILNDSCAMVVHVGHIKDEQSRQSYISHGFTLPAVQNLLHFAWKYEAQINGMFPFYRAVDYCCQPPSKHLYVPKNIVVRRIYTCDDLDSLYQFWEGSLCGNEAASKVAVYGLRGLSNKGNPNIYNGTIRFGQHQSSLDLDEIRNWVWFVGCLMQLSVDLGPRSLPLPLAEICGYKNQVPLLTMTTLDFIKIVSMNDQYQYYKQSRWIDAQEHWLVG